MLEESNSKTILPTRSKMSAPTYRSTLEGLPKQFVQSLRVLFDILDEERTGFVLLTDIEARWRDDDGVAGLPKGVLEALRKVTPPSGKLTFERFVAGLKIALLRNKSEAKASRDAGFTNTQPTATVPPTGGKSNQHPSSRSDSGAAGQHGPNDFAASGFRDRHHQEPTSSLFSSSNRFVPPGEHRRDYASKPAPNTAAVPPNNYQNHPMGRPKSLADIDSIDLDRINMPPPPPSVGATFRPETSGGSKWNSVSQLPDSNSRSAHSREDINKSLKQWQQERLQSEAGMRSSTSTQHRGFGDGRASNGPVTSSDPFDSGAPRSQDDIHVSPSRRVRRRESARRHTLASGIDYNMIKRMKQLEQEKDTLLQGLESAERLTEWYTEQITSVNDKMKFIGRGTVQNDCSVEASQERMNFLAARVSELNQQIRAIVESSSKGFPMHMNLAVPQNHPPQHHEPSDTDNLIAMLKAQNKMLTQELHQKTERMSHLEREKSTLIRDLFEKRSTNRTTNHDDTTFL